MIKLCLFDLDGTLINSLPAISHFSNTALTLCGFDAIDVQKYNYFAGNGRDILLHRALAYHNADTKENYEIIGKIYDSIYIKDPNAFIKPYDGITELLLSLKERGVKIAVCSNKPDHIVQLNIKHLFGDLFDYVLGQVAETPIKPAPDSAYNICKALNISPTDCLFIGDTDVDMKTGKNANMKSVGVLWGFREIHELKTAGADFIVTYPTEILDIL